MLRARMRMHCIRFHGSSRAGHHCGTQRCKCDDSGGGGEGGRPAADLQRCGTDVHRLTEIRRRNAAGSVGRVAEQVCATSGVVQERLGSLLAIAAARRGRVSATVHLRRVE